MRAILQGRITQDVDNLRAGEGAASLVLTPQGKILGQFVILKCDDCCILLSDELSEVQQQEFIDSILQFRVADRVEVVSDAPTVSVFTLQGPLAADVLGRLGANLPQKQYSHLLSQIGGIEARIINYSCGAASGFDLIVESASAAELRERIIAEPQVITGSKEALEMLRIELGIPLIYKDLTDKVSVGDIPLDDLVSFDKGCYAGQEVVEMTIARGKPNRVMRCFVTDGVAEIESGAELRKQLNDEKPCGFITSSASYRDEEKTRCIGFVKSEFENGKKFYAGDRGLIVI